MNEHAQRVGTVLAVIGAAVCAGALLLPWLELGDIAEDGPSSLSAWESFTALDIAFTVLAALAAGVALARLSRPGPALTLALAGLAGLLAVLSGLAIEYLSVSDDFVGAKEPSVLLEIAGLLLLVAGVGVGAAKRAPGADAPVGRALLAFAAAAGPLVALIDDEDQSLYESSSALDIVGVVVSVALMGLLLIAPTRSWAVWGAMVLGGYVAGFGALFALETVALGEDLTTPLWLYLLVVSPAAMAGGALLARQASRPPP